MKPWFSPTASWNRPASDFGVDTALDAEYRGRLTWVGGTDPGAQKPFGLMLRENTTPIVNRSDATTTARAYQRVSEQNRWLIGTIGYGGKFPWNPEWGKYIPPGTDRQIVIVDEPAGKAWELWFVDPGATFGYFDWIGPNNLNGYLVTSTKNRVGVGKGTVHNLLLTGSDADQKVGFGSTGIVKTACLLRAVEVASGRVEHRLSINVANPSYSPMTYRRPAKSLEHAGGPPTGAAGTNLLPLERTIPSGAAWYLDRDRAFIERWATRRGYTGALWATAVTVGTALAEFGCQVKETCGWGTWIETEGLMVPATRSVWVDVCGITDDGSRYPHADLLGGLVTLDAMRLLNQPGA